MNKGLVIGIAIIVLLVLGFGVYNVTIKGSSKEKQTATQDNGVEATTDMTTEESSAASSLRELLSRGMSQRCTFSTEADDAKTDGTIFAASGKMRGDISTTTSEKSIMSHMIFSNNELYVWMDGETNGMKMTFDPNKVQDEETKQKTVDLDEKVDYQCSGWVGDSSLFEVPSSVTFTDLTSLAIPTVPSSGSSEGLMGGNESGCAACENLTDEAKTQCKTALGCK